MKKKKQSKVYFTLENPCDSLELKEKKESNSNQSMPVFPKRTPMKNILGKIQNPFIVKSINKSGLESFLNARENISGKPIRNTEHNIDKTEYFSYKINSEARK